MTTIAVTGIGLVCSVASDRSEYVAAIRGAKLGISKISGLDLDWLPTDIGGEVKQLDPIVALGADADALTRADAFAVLAAREALGQSAIDLASVRPERIAVSIGTCQGNIAQIADFVRERAAGSASGRRHATSADVVAEWFAPRAARIVVSNACAAGSAAIAVVIEKLRNREIDVAIVGGTDELAFFTLAGFTVLQSLDPMPCAPYSRSGGLTVGEGAGILVLERAEDARARGREPIAHVLGFGLSADGYHPTAPDPTGRGGALAMERALRSAGMAPGEVDYVNGHGTGTPANDSMERKALRSLFGEGAPTLPMSSSKSMIGHLLGAAGAVEAATCVLAVENDLLPPTLGVPDGTVLDIDCVPNEARSSPVRVAMSTNYAFGGSNSALLIGKRTVSVDAPIVPRRRIFVTGIGCVGAAGVGLSAWRDRLTSGETMVRELTGTEFDGLEMLGAEAPDVSARGVAAPDAWRKMDPLARLAMTSARSAWDDAVMALSAAEKENVAVILATACGSLDITLRFEAAARRGKGFANAKDFPHTSMNSPAGHVCTVLGLHGPMLSISNGGVAGLSAVAFASDLIRYGHVDRALVVAVDQLSRAVIDLLPSMGYVLSPSRLRPFHSAADGTSGGAAAVTLVLESEDSTKVRGVHPYAELLETVVVGTGPNAEDSAESWTIALHEAMERSGLSTSDDGYIAAAAGGLPGHDDAEARAIAKQFGRAARVGAPKSMLGECLASSGAINIVAAALAMRDGILLPVLDLAEPGAIHDLNYVREVERDYKGDFAIASAVAVNSSVACTVLRHASAT